MLFQEAFDFSGKTVLVTGASSGIGRASAILLSELGAKTILVARREEKLKETISLLSGEGHQYYVADLTETSTIEELIKKIVVENGLLYGMVYSAGVGITIPISAAKPEKVSSVLNVNFLAFYEMVRQFIKKKNHTKEAKIVAVSSMASEQSNKGHSVYVASKAAMDAAVRCIAQELCEKGITINTIRPGWVKTEMYRSYLVQNPEQEEIVKKEQPLGVIEPVVIAEQIVYLLSSCANQITGTSIAISGGQV